MHYVMAENAIGVTRTIDYRMAPHIKSQMQIELVDNVIDNLLIGGNELLIASMTSQYPILIVFYSPSCFKFASGESWY